MVPWEMRKLFGFHHSDLLIDCCDNIPLGDWRVDSGVLYSLLQ